MLQMKVIKKVQQGVRQISMAKNLINILLKKNNSLEEDKRLLQELYSILQNSTDEDDTTSLEEKERKPVIIRNSHSYSKDDLEAHFLNQIQRGSASIPRKNISDFILDKDIICKFVFVIFERHYGWTERCSNDDAMIEQSSCRNELNMLYEKWIAWLENHDYLSYYLLSGYRFALKSSPTLAAVRKQIIFSVFRWFKNLSNKYIIVPDKCYNVLKSVVLFGLTDVWSAIRKDTASRLGYVLELLTEEHLEDLFLALIQICGNEKGSWQTTETWQATEGAIRGIDKVLTSCKYVATSSVRKVDAASTPSVLIKIGRNNFSSLPQYMKENIERILFKLFAHPQFSIREVAGKTFSSFLNKSDFSYLVESFENIVKHLHANQKKKNGSLMFMDACEAEGFMNAVLFLIKSIPLTHLIQNWYEYWSVFTHYLIHPASTVRQTASSVFKYLVSKDLTSIHHMKLVFQGLCSEWKTELTILTNLSTDFKKVDRKSVFDSKKNEDIAECWEWREGRLFAYELIMKFLITNHLYFSMTTSSSHHLYRKKNNSLNNSITEGQFRMEWKQISMSQPTRVDMSRNAVTKSFTMSRLRIVEIEPPSKSVNEKNESLISISRLENIEQGVFLVSSVPALKPTPLPSLPVKYETTQTELYNAQQKISTWLSQQTYCSYYTLLKQILIQTIECLHDSRWELRRMSTQLLPNVCEVIRLYNYQLLEDLYIEATKAPSSELYYGSCFCLLNSIKCFIKLKKISSDKFSPHKSIDKRQSNAEEMMSQIGNKINEYVAITSKYIPHVVCETSNMSVVILLLYKITFKKEPLFFDKIICDYFHNISNCITVQKSKATRKSLSKYLLDLLCEIQTHLLEYCDTSPVEHTILLPPVFLQAVHLSQSNSLDVQVMLACCESILHKLKQVCHEHVICYMAQLSTTCHEICHIFENTELEALYLRQAFNITIALQSVMADEFPLSSVTNTVNAKLKQVSVSSKFMAGDFIASKPEFKTTASVPDDLLSYSTASFDSLRMSDEASSDSDSEQRHGAEVDEGSDWDWSSGDEVAKDDSSLHEVYTSFLAQLTSNSSKL